MSNSRIIAVMAAWIVVASAIPAAAQLGEPGLSGGPSARPFTDSQSLFNADFFDYDAQMWAPFDVTSLDRHWHAHTGLYFAFDWANISISRPGPQFGIDPRLFNSGNDFAWGNRYNVGFMSESGKGLDLSWLSIEGGFFTNGQNDLISQPMLVRSSVDSVDLNRTFRQELHNGGYLEPYFGLRVLNVNDNVIDDAVLSAVQDIRFTQSVKNSSFGGQIGARYFRRYGRWQVSVDGGIAALFNTQRYFASSLLIDTTNALIAATEGTLEDQDFVPVLDLDMTLSFAITRDISLRVGAVLMYAWDGVARANILNVGINPYSVLSPIPFPVAISDPEDFTGAGVTFGIDWRR